jgi:hypothetical protein
MIEDAQNGIGGPGDVERSIDRLLEAIDMDCRDTSIAKPNVRSA